jgi:hypothetical protein
LFSLQPPSCAYTQVLNSTQGAFRSGCDRSTMTVYTVFFAGTTTSIFSLASDPWYWRSKFGDN